MSNDDIERVAKKTLMFYLQSWGQDAETRHAAFADACQIAGISDTPNGPDAREFDGRLQSIWTGKFETEVAAIASLIREFRGRA